MGGRGELTNVVIRSSIEQAQAAEKLGRALEGAGFQTWRSDSADDDFWHSDEVVERIGAAEAAVFIWSSEAAASALFRAEANSARQQGKLIQLSADGQAPPVPFDQVPVAELSGWNGEARHPGFQHVLSEAKSLGQPSAAPASLETGGTSSSLFQLKPARALLVIALMSGAAAAGWIGGRQHSSDDGREAVASAAHAPLVTEANARASVAPPKAAAAPKPAVPPAKRVRLDDTPAPKADRVTTATKPKETVTVQREKPEKNASERNPERLRKASAAKAEAAVRPKPKPARPRIKYRYSENMRLFCQGTGRTTPQCRLFRRNAPKTAARQERASGPSFPR